MIVFPPTNNVEFTLVSPRTNKLLPKETSEPTNKREFTLKSLAQITLPVSNGLSNVSLDGVINGFPLRHNDPLMIFILPDRFNTKDVLGVVPIPRYLETNKLPPIEESSFTNSLEFILTSPCRIVFEPTYKLEFKEASPPTNSREFILTSPRWMVLDPTNKLAFKDVSPITTTLFPRTVFPPTNNLEFILTSPRWMVLKPTYKLEFKEASPPTNNREFILTSPC